MVTSAHRRTRSPRRRDRRSGLVLGVVLVCVVVAVMLATAVTKSAMLNRRQLEQANWQQQAAWLAEAGAQRAVHRLHVTPDYIGETWEPSVSSLSPGHSGSVVIRVQTHLEESVGRYIRVEAKYPCETPQGVLAVREVAVAVPVAVSEGSSR